jgi:hypothetical protein
LLHDDLRMLYTCGPHARPLLPPHCHAGRTPHEKSVTHAHPRRAPRTPSQPSAEAAAAVAEAPGGPPLPPPPLLLLSSKPLLTRLASSAVSSKTVTTAGKSCYWCDNPPSTPISKSGSERYVCFSLCVCACVRKGMGETGPAAWCGCFPGNAQAGS